MHEVLVNRLGGLSLPRKSVVTLPDRPDMTSDVYRGRKATTTTKQQHNAETTEVVAPLFPLEKENLCFCDNFEKNGNAFH